MKWKNRHPYLFWQMIGFSMIIADVIFSFFASQKYDKDFYSIAIPISALSGLLSLIIIVDSPFVVFMNRRKDRLNSRLKPTTVKEYTERLNHYIDQIYLQMHPIRSELLPAVLGFFLLVISLIGMLIISRLNLFLGLMQLLLMPYVFLIMTDGFKKRRTSRFYAIDNGDRYCELITMDDSSMTDTLYTDNTMVFFYSPDPIFLHFLYNLANHQHGLNGDSLQIYIVSKDNLLKTCGAVHQNTTLEHIDSMLCIPYHKLIAANRNSSTGQADTVSLYDPIIPMLGFAWFHHIVNSLADHYRLGSIDLCTVCDIYSDQYEAHTDGIQFEVNPETNGVILHCTGCDTYFDTPEQALVAISSKQELPKRCRPAKWDEIIAAGWESFVEPGPILSNERIFGIKLYENAHLRTQFEQLFTNMIYIYGPTDEEPALEKVVGFTNGNVTIQASIAPEGVRICASMPENHWKLWIRAFQSHIDYYFGHQRELSYGSKQNW